MIKQLYYSEKDQDYENNRRHLVFTPAHCEQQEKRRTSQDANKKRPVHIRIVSDNGLKKGPHADNLSERGGIRLMSDLSDEDFKKLLREAVREELDSRWPDPFKHHAHHKFLDGQIIERQDLWHLFKEILVRWLAMTIAVASGWGGLEIIQHYLNARGGF